MTLPLTIAYVTDRRMFPPTLFSLHSALTHGTSLDVLLVGVDLDKSMWDSVRRLEGCHPGSRVRPFALPPEWLAEAQSLRKHITTTAFGRLFLPRIMGGRVLYVDGDTLVTGDLSLAGPIDMEGNPIAGVRDFSAMKWIHKGRDEPLQRQANLMPPGFAMNSYINSGVLLMDNDKIRATPGLVDRMEDMAAAARFPTLDQDRINEVFAGRITHLDPSWNCSWGRLARQRHHAGNRPAAGRQPSPMILHFHGPAKPWHRPRLSMLTKGGLAVWRYRRELRAFRRLFPDLFDASRT